MRIATSLRALFAVALLAVVTIAGAAGPARSASFPYPDGTVISLVVPWGPGGGNDLVLRVLQPSFQNALNALGGHVTVIVTNKPGAGAQIGTEYVYNSPPDGTQLVVLGADSAALQESILHATFHISDFTYVGVLNDSTWGIVVRSDLGINDMKSLIARAQQKPILAGTAGAGGGDHIAWLLTQAALEKSKTPFPLNFVHFNSSTAVFASMQRGEAEAYYGSNESLIPATSAGYAKMIVLFGKNRVPSYPNVATAFEQRVPSAELISSLVGTTRVLAGPPNIPADRAAVLRKALQMALSDPALLSRARTDHIPISYAPAERAKQVTLARLKILENYRDIVAAAFHGAPAK